LFDQAPGARIGARGGRLVAGAEAANMPAVTVAARALNLPNILSATRIALAPVLLGLAWGGASRAFLLTLCVSLLTDIVDGKLARRLGQTSELGAKLDSWGDLATYMSVPLCAWWLRPDFVRAEAPFFIAVVASYTVPVAVGFARYRRLTSYHTRAATVAAYLVGGATVVLFAGAPAWPFRLATAALVYAELEELAITALLPVWRANVPSWRHALAERRALQAPTTSSAPE
jgi:phosphatidylglycerophosphate synthase